KASLASGRNVSDITVIGVTKNHPAEYIKASLELGINNIGESYIQEAVKKNQDLKLIISPEEYQKINWHFIGNMQTNKIKHLRDSFTFLHSIDNQRQIDEINKRFTNKTNIFLEINVGNEDNKGGINIDETRYLLELIMKTNESRKVKLLPEIELKGLMCIPPANDNPEFSRQYFKMLKNGMEILNQEFSLKMDSLSMGMSNDFDIAIEEGSTHVRIGTLLYGERV
ncbi:MAG: YggS family pyridoxal phosphate-dependent enzyme, partial [bacterium]